MLVLSVSLVGCVDRGARAPVIARPPTQAPAAARYVVQKGDTVFAIAFRLGCDYRTLASQNHIEPPYLIYPGRRLSMACANGEEVPPLSLPGQTGAAAASRGSTDKPSPVRPASGQSGSAADAASAPPGVAPKAFFWPAAGRVLRGYGPAANGASNKGIDISGVTGDAVLAAADGEVVYAGDGLRGYGPLLILKHGEIYLTAYGHNDRLLVREGDRVKARQKIAEIGSNGSDESSLHFEIRREGRPLDPLPLLTGR